MATANVCLETVLCFFWVLICSSHWLFCIYIMYSCSAILWIALMGPRMSNGCWSYLLATDQCLGKIYQNEQYHLKDQLYNVYRLKTVLQIYQFLIPNKLHWCWNVPHIFLLVIFCFKTPIINLNNSFVHLRIPNVLFHGPSNHRMSLLHLPLERKYQ